MRGPPLAGSLALGLCVAGSVALSAACAHEGDRMETAPATIGRPGPDTVTGRVRRAGNVPFVRTLVEEEGEAVAVTGEHEPEIARLVGARVRVSGVRTDGPMGPELRASAYAILSVDGEVPEVGLLRREADGYRLVRARGDTLDLRVVPESFAELAGARVWLVLEGGAVTRHGVLRRPEEAGRR